ncbi:hypothetical protein, partial [Klebsiella pneumoniae]|uniref:hypothetical protein n=1 Tax=Klebsiella pneumoniae TaxID=573 RepID=UPI001954D0E8
TLTGSRYTGRGITLTMNKSGTILRHGKRGPTRCTRQGYRRNETRRLTLPRTAALSRRGFASSIDGIC